MPASALERATATACQLLPTSDVAATTELPLRCPDGNRLESWVSFCASRNEREDWEGHRGTGAHLFVQVVLPCHFIRLRRAWKLVMEVRDLLGLVQFITLTLDVRPGCEPWPCRFLAV